MDALAHLCHASTGRLRLRVPEKRHDVGYFDNLVEVLSPLPGIDGIETNPLTASALLHHTLDTEEVVALVEERGAIAIKRRETRSVPLAGRLAAQLRTLDRSVRDLTEGELDLLSLVFIVLLGMAVVQLLTGNIAVPATTLVWYALSLVLLAPAIAGTR